MERLSGEVVDRLDEMVRRSETAFDDAAVVMGARKLRFTHWYDRVLSSVGLLVGSDRLLFGEGVYDATDHAGRVFVLTDRAAIVVSLESVDGDVAVWEVTAVPRGSVTSITVSTEMGANTELRQNRTWPGMVTLTIHYDSLDTPVVVHAAGFDRFDSTKKAPVLELLEAIRDDLAKH